MQSKDTCTATIIGGSYKETCDLYGSCDLQGSGLRALELFMELGWNGKLRFASCAGKFKPYIESKYSRRNVSIHITDGADVEFNYDHPFRMGSLYPRADVLYKNKKHIDAVDENVLVYGMVDADFMVKGRKVVYDPQTTVMIPPFRARGSEADELVLVLNAGEARAMSGEIELEFQRNKIFEKENCSALVIKQGAKGAILYRGIKDEGIKIPIFMTPNVNSIGSGDVFTATLAYNWFNGCSLEQAAIDASKAVACYVVKHQMKGLKGRLSEFEYEPLEYRHDGQIYLAGPFFSFSQRWLINQLYQALKGEDVKVFSPLHDVGVGDADEVTEPDINGLLESNVVLAVVDGLDSGTLFEVGYAVAHKKKVVAYVQNESRKALQMLEGTGCDIEQDFTTAVYKACWYAAQ